MCGYRMDPMVAWILWSGLVGSQDCVLYSVIDGAMSKLPCTGRAAGWGPRPVQPIVWGPDSGGPMHWILWPSEATSLLCRWGKPQVVLSAEVPLYVGLLDQLCNFPCALVRFMVGKAEAVCIDEQAYQLNSFCRLHGRSHSKISEALCCLSSGQPVPKGF